jgi:HEAT repeat protein
MPDEEQQGTGWKEKEIDNVIATQKILPLLNDSSDRVRSITAFALGGIGDTRTLKPLLMALKDEESEAVCVEIEKAIKRIVDRVGRHNKGNPR